jgi:hypothetical protein
MHPGSLLLVFFVAFVVGACGNRRDEAEPNPDGAADAYDHDVFGNDADATSPDDAGPDGNDGGHDGGLDGGDGGLDILAALALVPNATVTELLPSDGYRHFEIRFQQPLDHDVLTGPWFEQTLELSHHDVSAPMVLVLSGYDVSRAAEGEAPSLLGANVLSVPHRFFQSARPEPLDWTKLTIQQAAADDHRIVEAFRPIYSGRWISTGVSKGGMAALYHRRFYSQDVDGTVAYVAPLSLGLADARYRDFLDRVGDDACRQQLRVFQREILLRRQVIEAWVSTDALSSGVSYDLYGVAAAVESAVINFPFSFWSTGAPENCTAIPDASSSDANLYWFIRQNILANSDGNRRYLEPYYWQAETELGRPSLDSSAIQDLLTVDWSRLDWFPNIDFDPVFRSDAMLDVANWVATEGDTLMFIYGADDPWSAGAVELGAARDSYRFFAPHDNHDSSIASLAPADRAAALSALASWAQVPTTASSLPRVQRPATFGEPARRARGQRRAPSLLPR